MKCDLSCVRATKRQRNPSTVLTRHVICEQGMLDIYLFGTQENPSAEDRINRPDTESVLGRRSPSSDDGITPRQGIEILCVQQSVNASPSPPLPVVDGATAEWERWKGEC